jgi:hypothetical protein
MPRTETTPSPLCVSLVASLSPETALTSKLQESRASTVIKASIMIIRSLLRAQAPKIAGRRTFRIPNRTFKTTRRYSTSNASMASPTPQSQASMLATITTDLDKIAPRFEIQPEQIEIIQTPAEFYETLKVGCFPHVLFNSFARSLVVVAVFLHSLSSHSTFLSSIECVSSHDMGIS